MTNHASRRVLPLGLGIAVLGLLLVADLLILSAVTSDDPSGLQYMGFALAWVPLGISAVVLAVSAISFSFSVFTTMGPMGTLAWAVLAPEMLGYGRGLDAATMVVVPTLSMLMLLGLSRDRRLRGAGESEAT